MKRIILLGATGSIGRSACDVVRAHPERFKVVALAVRENLAAAALLGREFGAKVYSGETGAVRAVEENDADLVLVATVGLSGLSPTLTALGKGMTVALATKEVLVAAGELVTAAAAAAGRPIIPVDSEHSAIFQCLQGPDAARSVSRLILTASGGPFLDEPRDLGGVTPEQALNHPRWDMGPKVTIDSATMMNKGFEIIEAFWLFGLPVERIDVVVHPESIVHSLVEFSDGATLAQLAPPDMRVPIQYAFTWPERLPAARAPLDLVALGALTFRAPDETRFPALRLAKERGIMTLGIVNVVGSSIAREADRTFYTLAGPEIAVATTKGYMTQLVVTYMLAMQFGLVRGHIDEDTYLHYIAELRKIPAAISKILEEKERLQWFAAKYAGMRDSFYIGRGIDYAVCQEGSLKMKEISYVHSEAYAGGELKHGTISLIEDGILVVGVLTQDDLFEKTISNMVECKSRGAYLMGLTTYGHYEIEETADFVIYVPRIDSHFVGCLAVVPLQLLGYYVAVAKGLDVDKPRNLAKSVTVE